ncbi:MAG: tRNA (adenosine(37)-N6)-threonylcarbamoyltransferase complex ATPase subunit type 1 TsaE [Solirubrobacteraceae bacterium]
MSRAVHITENAEQTTALAATLAKDLSGGDVVVLHGELGSGKSTFVRGACRALGVEGPVTSPTFAIGNRYRGAGGLQVCHLDLYRASDLDDLLEPYIGAGRITFIEWGGDYEPVRMRVRIEHAGGDRRRIEVEPR